MMVTSICHLTAYLDNSSAFAEYLRKYGMDDALETLGLELRQKHCIVPHVRVHAFVVAFLLTAPPQRLHVPLDAEPNALPSFSNEQEWYIYVSRARSATAFGTEDRDRGCSDRKFGQSVSWKSCGKNSSPVCPNSCHPASDCVLLVYSRKKSTSIALSESVF
jgi:hypothetical protein